MRNVPAAVVLSGFVALTLPLGTNAGFRCRDGNLVNEGDSIAFLLNQCGEPSYRSQILDNRGHVIGEQLFYKDRLDPKWFYTIDVVNGKVTKVASDRE